MNRVKSIIIIIASANILSWMLAEDLFVSKAYAANNTLLINEIQTGNIDSYIDPSYNYGGWIEFYNPTSASIALSSFYISDDPEDLQKYRFKSTAGTVSSKGFLTVWFDHNSADGTYGSKAGDQVRFKLDADGGTLYISDAVGKLVFSQEYPAAISRCSYARTTDGGDTWRWTSTPTPGATNNGSKFADTQLPAPEVLTNSGLISTSTDIEINRQEGVIIRYTTNGSTPTATNGAILEQGNKLKAVSTMVFRFRAFKEGYLPSPVVTRTFVMRDKNYTLPIVSITTDNKNLYDNTIGVYTDGTNGVSGRGIDYRSNKNMDWERPVNFEYITKDGQCVFNQEATFYVSGGWSRHWPPTSFKIKAEKRYEGLNSLDYPFFSEKPYNKNKVIVMRNGGNDNGARAKDAMIQHIIQSSGFYVDGQAYNPCHVFINGKYHAMLNMREPNNKFFAYANYGIDTDNIDAYEMGDGTYKQMAGTNASFQKWLSFASSASNESTYKQIIDTYVDIDEYINYMAAECYIGCSDWLTNNNNCKGFKARDNGRFHHVMFDTDSGFDFNDMLSKLKGSTMNGPTSLFNRMSKNNNFKKQFVATYCIVNGSIFAPDRVKEAGDFVGHASEAALALDGQNPWGTINGVVSAINNTNNRTMRMNALKNFFSLGIGYNVQLNSNIKEALLTINNVPVPTNKFDGLLYAPFTLAATAPAGYNFVGWKMGKVKQETLMAKGQTWSYYDKGSLDGKDWKSASASLSGWKQGLAPLGYSKDGLKTNISYGPNANEKYPTCYFRNTLTLSEEPNSAEEYRLDYVVDDGFVVYVNGVEAGRYLMPDGTPYFNTFATTYSYNNPDSGSLLIDPKLLHKGTNIIAVEVHNNSYTSTDLYWDASIVRTSNQGEISITERELDVQTLTETRLYTAVFEKIPEECLVAAGQTPVVINEVSAGNTIFVNDYFKKNDWIELYNTTSEDIDIAGMYLSDDAGNPHKYQITADMVGANTIIPAYGYKVIWADKLSPITQLHANFKLGNNDGECIMLTAQDDSWKDVLNYDQHQGDETVGRYPDGGKRVYRMATPTIGKRNMITTYAQWLAGEDVNFDVEGYLSNIDSPTTDRFAEAKYVEYYTIDGIKLNAPRKGLNIVREVLSNGTSRTKKIIIE